MWSTLGPYLLGGGLLGVMTLLARVYLTLHRDAIESERRRGDEAVARAIAAEKRADLREDQMGILLGRTKDPAS